MNSPFQESVGVCPKCKRPNAWRKMPGFFHPLGQYKCYEENGGCGSVFYQPETMQLRTSSTRLSSDYQNHNKSHSQNHHKKIRWY